MSIDDFMHPVVVVILMLAGFVFYRLLIALFSIEHGDVAKLGYWQSSLNQCICALPLLGLLGTIMGLLDSFSAISQGDGLHHGSDLSSGIAAALWTTQLGLVMAVPAWLLHAYTQRKLRIKESSDAI